MFHFGEVKEGTKSLALGGPVSGIVVEEVEAKVDEAADGGLAVYENVALLQMQASWPDEEVGCFVIKYINPVPLPILETYGSVDGVPEVHMSPHQVLPVWR